MRTIEGKLRKFTGGLLVWTATSAVVLTSVIGSFCIIGAFRQMRSMIEDGLVSKGLLLVHNNSHALKGMAEDNAFSAIQALVAETVAGDKDVMYGIFMDARQQAWAWADSANPSGMPDGMRVLDDSVSAWTASLERAAYRQGTNGVIDFAAPVMGEFGRLGTIRYGISAATAERAVAATKRRWFASGSVFGLFYVIVIFILYGLALRRSRKHAAELTRPLGALVDATGSITAGRYDHEVRVESDDEIGRLAESFETMRKEISRYTRHLEDMVADRTAALERSNRELTDFAHIASHDLQEPLRKVTAFGDRLATRAGSALDDRSKDYLARMQNAARRMSGLLDGLLGYARVTTKGSPFKTVDMDKVTAEVLGDLEVRINETGGRVDTGSLGTVEADPLQMRQLVQNLVGNALKYHKPDVPPVVNVSARVTDDGAWYELTVADNGIGIADEDKEKAFGIFQRLVGKSEYEGRGVGLAICKKIAGRHDGTIALQGTVGAGTTFTVRLPVRGGGGNGSMENRGEPRAASAPQNGEADA